VSVVDVARVIEEIIATGGFAGEALVVAGEDHTMDELVEAVERASGRTGRVDHASPAMMRLLAAVLRVVRPVLADQIRAGLLMDTADMRMSPAERLERFPSIPVTTLEEAIARELRPASAAPLPSPAPVRPG
jgi:nucleoside-diphosphate-sugar epimerase